jgi:hypothetical protein
VPRVLHLIVNQDRAPAREVIAEQARDPAVTVSVVLGEGVDWATPPGVRRLRLAARAGEAPDTVDYPHLLGLIFDADTVVTW